MLTEKKWKTRKREDKKGKTHGIIQTSEERKSKERKKHNKVIDLMYSKFKGNKIQKIRKYLIQKTTSECKPQVLIYELHCVNLFVQFIYFSLATYYYSKYNMNNNILR